MTRFHPSMMMPGWALLLVLLLAAACTEEKPITPRDRSGSQDSSATNPPDGEGPSPLIRRQLYYGEGYAQQLWYSLAEDSVVAQCRQSDWDLAFDCRTEVFRVYLNSARVMQAAATAETDWAAAERPASSAFRPDHPSGVADSLALGGALPEGVVCWIDLGYSVDGERLGYRKVSFERLAEGYVLRHSRPGAEAPTGVDTLRKDATYNTLTYSLLDGRPRQVAPPKTDYDLLFTSYTHLFYAPYTPYRVSGAWLNPHQTRAYLRDGLDDTAFAALDASAFEAHRLSEARDVPGYNWKTYSLDEGVYTVHREQVYLFETQHGERYKLRFVGFNNREGKRGYPSFEYRRL